MGLVLGDAGFGVQLVEAGVVSGVVVLEQFVLVVVLESDQRLLDVFEVEDFALEHVHFVHLRGDRIQGQLDIDLVHLAAAV